ncbi:MAG: energy transducer TonB [Acidobacteriota bacterium]
MPRPLASVSPPPRYPLAAMRDEIEGLVTLMVRIDIGGRVSAVETLETAPEGQGFSQAAVAAVSGWRYSPALLDGHPVAAYTLVTVSFEPEREREDRLWAERRAGLESYARSSLYPEAPNVAGEDGVSLPEVLKKRSPVNQSYPRAARLRQIRSRAVVLVEVKSDGTVGEILLANAEKSGFGFEKAAGEAVGQWLFAPAMKNGVAVDAWHWVEIEFTP